MSIGCWLLSYNYYVVILHSMSVYHSVPPEMLLFFKATKFYVCNNLHGEILHTACLTQESTQDFGKMAITFILS